MYKKIIIGLISASVLMLGVFGYMLITDMSSSKPEAKGDNQAEKTLKEKAGDHRETIQGVVTDEQLEEYETEDLNPFGENVPSEGLTDMDIQEYIHGMSHQKVQAEKKWGFYELHPKRVKWLLEAVEKSGDLLYADDYKQILHKWAESDFSTIDDDHNVIWRLQGGTVGKATGILSRKQEQDYLDSQ